MAHPIITSTGDWSTARLSCPLKSPAINMIFASRSIRRVARPGSRPLRRRRLSHCSRGQSLVEFALVLPMLLVLLLGIADFARVFTAGITIEAATRNGAEAGAIERLRNLPPVPGDPAEVDYYDSLHIVAAKAVCDEARLLDNTTYQASDGTCPELPVVRVCIHDGQDPRCGAPVPGFASTIPIDPDTGASRCPALSAMASGATNTSPGAIASHTVEVRACYRFTTLLNLHVQLPFGWGLALGDVWLERSREFIVDCPPGVVSTC